MPASLYSLICASASFDVTFHLMMDNIKFSFSQPIWSHTWLAEGSRLSRAPPRTSGRCHLPPRAVARALLPRQGRSSALHSTARQADLDKAEWDIETDMDTRHSFNCKILISQLPTCNRFCREALPRSSSCPSNEAFCRLLHLRAHSYIQAIIVTNCCDNTNLAFVDCRRFGGQLGSHLLRYGQLVHWHRHMVLLSIHTHCGRSPTCHCQEVNGDAHRIPIAWNIKETVKRKSGEE